MPEQFRALRSFGDLADVMEADRRRHERNIELAYFGAWCTEMFARQPRLDQWDVALKKLRTARNSAGPSGQIVDWHLEKEQMRAIRKRYEAADLDKKRKTTK